MIGDVVIIGAGLSGLACALALRDRGFEPLILERSDTIGGRVHTDRGNGFLLDRGFQVLQTWYPEARQMLDYAALDLRPFEPGALVRIGGRFHRVSDVWRTPRRIPEMLVSPVGTLRDKLRMLALRRRALRGSLQELYKRPESDALTYLKAMGFSHRMIERFFKPFFGGVFFEPDLRVSSHSFEFVFRAFALGDTALPARGMGQIPAQLAAQLPVESMRLGGGVRRLLDGGLSLDSGERLRASAVVVATGAREAARLLGRGQLPDCRGTTCFHFAAEQAPIPGPDLVLNAEGHGLINSLLVPSNLSEHYAPAGFHLVTVNLFGAARETTELEPLVRRELGDWFGDAPRGWETLAAYRLPEALPAQSPPVPYPGEHEGRIGERLWVCGELGNAPSIQWALHSGRRTGAAVAASLRRADTRAAPARTIEAAPRPSGAT
jgi:phytoene dehydrogenase-like protein